MFENIKSKFWSRYAEQLMELERRRIKKQERQKKKHESLKAGSIGYGLAMKQKPWEVYKSVLERRRYEREIKKKN
jgi:hypothetical protein